jgi:hypothetical protein
MAMQEHTYGGATARNSEEELFATEIAEDLGSAVAGPDHQRGGEWHHGAGAAGRRRRLSRDRGGAEASSWVLTNSRDSDVRPSFA